MTAHFTRFSVLLACLLGPGVVGCGAGAAGGKLPAGSALVDAAYLGDIARADQLLRAGTKPNSQWGPRAVEFFTERQLPWWAAATHWTALHAAADRHSLEMVRRLIEAGADVNADDGYGATPLVAALRARADDPCAAASVVDTFLAAGAAVNLRVRTAYHEPDSQTPLHLAAATGCPTIVKRLLDAGADPAAVDADGRTPADIAERWHASQPVINMLRTALKPLQTSSTDPART